MRATDVLTEAWLAEVLEDSLKMGWSAKDGARAIMSALDGGLVQLPQAGGQIVAPSGNVVMMQVRRATKAVEDAVASVRGMPACATWFSADTDYAIHEGDLEILLAALSPQAECAKEGPADAVFAWVEAQSHPSVATAWTCGLAATTLAWMLRLVRLNARIVTDEIRGSGHMWVQTDDTYYDPTIGQFGDFAGSGPLPHPLAVSPTGVVMSEPDYEPAWRSLFEPLRWMQGNKGLNAYLGWNLADIANDLIDRAYPGLRPNGGAA